MKSEQSPTKRKRSHSKTPPRTPEGTSEEKKQPDRKVDPVLEARKKKFESNEMNIKEGVIRLKPKNELEENEDGVAAAEEETDDVIDANIEDLFSDEETDNENEGRFKSVVKEVQKSPAVPFARLTNKENRNERKDKKERPGSRRKKQISRLMVRTDKQKVTPPVSTLPEKKIEIKIRNPTKYEEKKEQKEKVRKVEIGPRIEEEQERVPEGSGAEVMTVENEGDEDLVNLNEGAFSILI